MLIGLGGGAASSLASGTSSADLDFASVQRGNPEIERRAQEVIDRCWAMGKANPISADTRRRCRRPVQCGSGGGGSFRKHWVPDIELREVDNAEPGMSPMGIWCNEAQERYVLIVGR